MAEETAGKAPIAGTVGALFIRGNASISRITQMEKARLQPGLCYYCFWFLNLLLLLALGVSLLAVLASILGMLLSVGRMFFALCMIAFSMLFGGGAVRFGSVLVMFSCLIVLVSSHWLSPGQC